MTQPKSLSPRALTLTYLAALVVIGLIVMAGNLVASAYLDRQENDARTVNLAGRQRMLYLTISREALLAAVGEQVAQRRQACQRLQRAVAEWDRVHLGLVHGDSDLGLAALANPRARALLERLEESRRSILAAAQELIKTSEDCHADKALLPRILDQGDDYLPLMDRLVFLYAQESQGRVEALRQAELILDGITLLGLVAVGWFVFRPMVGRIADGLGQLRAAAEAYEDLSLTDQLTDLANRRAMDRHLDEEWRRAAREGHTLSLVMLDVDRFKQYNDTYGHVQGDRALQAVAKVVAATARRPGDLAVRYGGEELALVLPGAGLRAATGLAEQMRRAVQELAIPHCASGVKPVLTVSLGVASLQPGRDLEPASLIKAADDAMYRAKQSGRNRVETAA